MSKEEIQTALKEETIEYNIPHSMSKAAALEEDPKKPITIEWLISNMVSREVAEKFDQKIETLTKVLDEVYQQAFEFFKKQVIAREVQAAVAEAREAANMEAAREIERKFNLDNLIETIKSLPREITGIREQIAEKRQAQRTVRQSMADAELAVKEAEASLLADITAETNPATGKPMYSNDKARQAELMARKKTDPDYLAAVANHNSVKEQVNTLEDEIFSLDTKLKEIEAEFQGACKVLGAVTAEMNIFAQICGNNVRTLTAVGFIENDEKTCSMGYTVGTKSKENNTEEGAW